MGRSAGFAILGAAIGLLLACPGTGRTGDAVDEVPTVGRVQGAGAPTYPACVEPQLASLPLDDFGSALSVKPSRHPDDAVNGVSEGSGRMARVSKKKRDGDDEKKKKSLKKKSKQKERKKHAKKKVKKDKQKRKKKRVSAH